LSRLVGGHPLSLRLLGLAFNDIPLGLGEFIRQHEALLLQAEDKYKGPDHRHRTLFAAVDTSVRFLPVEARQLLSGLWLFRGAFLPETAVELFDPDGEYPEGKHSPALDRLHLLWRRGLLEAEDKTFASGAVRLYRLLPGVRLYAEKHLEQEYLLNELQERYGQAYAGLVRGVYQELDRRPEWVWLAQQGWADFEQAAELVPLAEQGWYWLRWGWVMSRLGDRRAGQKRLEQALEAAQGQDQALELQALNNLAGVYQATGQPGKARELYEQALPILREVGDRAGEATTLNNLAGVYQATGQPGKARELYEQALPILREVGDRAGEAATLSNLALVYQATGQPGKARELYEQALPIRQEVGDRAGEAATLNNLAGVYQATGQMGKARELYEQALPILREVGDRAGEATTLNNLAALYYQDGQPERTADILRQIIEISREIGDVAKEAAFLHNLAAVEWQALRNPTGATALVTRSIRLLETHTLSQDAAGVSLAQHRETLAMIASGAAASEDTQTEAGREVMQAIQEWLSTETWAASRQVLEQRRELLFRPEVEAIFEANIEQAEKQGQQEFTQMLAVHLNLLRDSKSNGIAAAYERIEAALRTAANARKLPESVPADFVERCAAGLIGPPQEKQELFNYLVKLPAPDPELVELIKTVQLALLGDDLDTLGQNLSGDYQAVWLQIVGRIRNG